MVDKGGHCHLKRLLLRAEVVLGIVLKALQEVLDFFFQTLVIYCFLSKTYFQLASKTAEALSKNTSLGTHSWCFSLASFIRLTKSLAYSAASLFCLLQYLFSTIYQHYNAGHMKQQDAESWVLWFWACLLCVRAFWQHTGGLLL